MFLDLYFVLLWFFLFNLNSFIALWYPLFLVPWFKRWSWTNVPLWSVRKITSKTQWISTRSTSDIWLSCFECSNQLPTWLYFLAVLPFPNVFYGLFSTRTHWTEPVKFSKHLPLLWSPAACCSSSCWRTTESGPMRWTTTTDAMSTNRSDPPPSPGRTEVWLLQSHQRPSLPPPALCFMSWPFHLIN